LAVDAGTSTCIGFALKVGLLMMQP